MYSVFTFVVLVIVSEVDLEAVLHLAGEAGGDTDVGSLVLCTDEGDDQSGNVGPDHLAGAGVGDLVPGEAGWRIS